MASGGSRAHTTPKFESIDARRSNCSRSTIRLIRPIQWLLMPSRRSTKGGRPVRSEVGDGAVVTKLSPWSMADTLARLLAVVAAQGMEVFAVIDHSGKARDVGLALRETKVVIFGSPSVTTPVIEAAPLAALDLPFRVAVWA